MSRKRSRLTGTEALEQEFAKVDHAPLLAALGVDLPHDILTLALTHRSFANENGMLPNNERLEFLGDAVLGLSVAGKLFEQYPHPTRIRYIENACEYRVPVWACRYRPRNRAWPIHSPGQG